MSLKGRQHLNRLLQKQEERREVYGAWCSDSADEKAPGFAGVGAAERERVRKQEDFTKGSTLEKNLAIHKAKNGQKLF